MRSSNRNRSVTRRARGRQILRRYGAVLGLLVLGGCSSAPDQPDAELARKNQASRYTESGNSFFEQADYDLALSFFELALQENIAVDNLPGIAKSYNSIGRVYAAAGDPEEARANYALAMEFADLANSDPERIETYINRGELALRIGDDGAAITEFERAQEIVATGDDLQNPILLHNLGTLYAREGRLDEAVTQLERARVINEEANNWTELASNYYMLASIASRRQDFATALVNAEQALSYDKRAENSVGIAADLAALGQISERTGDNEDAFQYYLRSLRVYLTLDLVDPTLELLVTLQRVATATGRDADAVEFAAQEARIRSAVRSTTNEQVD